MVLRLHITNRWCLVIRKSPANAGDVGVMGLNPGLGRSLGGEPGNQLQYSCLESPIDRGAWRATVHRVTKRQTQLKQLSTHACIANNGTGWNSTQDREHSSSQDVLKYYTAAQGAWDPPAFVVTILYYHLIWPEVPQRSLANGTSFCFHVPTYPHRTRLSLSHQVFINSLCVKSIMSVAFIAQSEGKPLGIIVCMCVSAHLCICVLMCLWAQQNIPGIVLLISFLCIQGPRQPACLANTKDAVFDTSLPWAMSTAWNSLWSIFFLKK